MMKFSEAFRGHKSQTTHHYITNPNTSFTHSYSEAKLQATLNKIVATE